MADDNKKSRSVFIAVVTSWAGLAACSSSTSGENPGGTGSNSTVGSSTNAGNCPTWTDATHPLDAYGGADVTHAGTSFKFVLMNSTPSPPALGTITWKIKLVDASGQPVKDATFPTIKPWMPQHSHGSTALPMPTNDGDGTYTIDNLYLYMPGVWQVTLAAKSGSATDTAVFTFCLGS